MRLEPPAMTDDEHSGYYYDMTFLMLKISFIAFYGVTPTAVKRKALDSEFCRIGVTLRKASGGMSSSILAPAGMKLVSRADFALDGSI